jgi:hypothetical protein
MFWRRCHPRRNSYCEWSLVAFKKSSTRQFWRGTIRYWLVRVVLRCTNNFFTCFNFFHFPWHGAYSLHFHLVAVGTCSAGWRVGKNESTLFGPHTRLKTSSRVLIVFHLFFCAGFTYQCSHGTAQIVRAPLLARGRWAQCEKPDWGQQVGLFSLSYMVHGAVMWSNFSSLLFSFWALFCPSDKVWSLCGWQAVVGEFRETFTFG